MVQSHQPSPSPPRHILPVIVLATFAGTSLWFSGNAVFADLQASAGFSEAALGQMTIAIQLGFILGTLVFAVFAIADRNSPRVVFLFCAVAGGLSNAAALVGDVTLSLVLATRFAAGFFLAGIYPVGMKIAASWFDRDLGKALGFMVGALVLGTAFPHLLRGLGGTLPWEGVLATVSAFAMLGGVAMFALVPDGPYLKSAAAFDPRAVIASFRSADFRASAFGYFGHMWELYVFWAFVPLFIAVHPSGPHTSALVALWAFAVIGAGTVGCFAGGLISQSVGSARVAFAQLGASGLCCLVSPLALVVPFEVAITFLIFWGVVAPGDSPQFSALNSRYAPAQLVGSALTIVNSIGFLITIIALAVASLLLPLVGAQYIFVFLVPGPLLGLMALRRLVRHRDAV